MRLFFTIYIGQYFLVAFSNSEMGGLYLMAKPFHPNDLIIENSTPKAGRIKLHFLIETQKNE